MRLPPEIAGGVAGLVIFFIGYLFIYLVILQPAEDDREKQKVHLNQLIQLEQRVLDLEQKHEQED